MKYITVSANAIPAISAALARAFSKAPLMTVEGAYALARGQGVSAT